MQFRREITNARAVRGGLGEAVPRTRKMRRNRETAGKRLQAWARAAARF